MLPGNIWELLAVVGASVVFTAVFVLMIQRSGMGLKRRNE